MRCSPFADKSTTSTAKSTTTKTSDYREANRARHTTEIIMKVPAFVILLSAVLVTAVLGRRQRGERGGCLQTLDVEPLESKYLLIGVVSDEPISDLKERFRATDLLHSFKFIGKNRYIFVIKDDGNVTTFRELELPYDAVVYVYPVEPLSEFFVTYGIDVGWQECERHDNLEDDVVINLQWLTVKSQAGDTTKKLMDALANFSVMIDPVHDAVKRVTYGVIAEYPPQLIFFNQIEANALQSLVKCELDLLGGPANVIFENFRLVKV